MLDYTSPASSGKRWNTCCWCEVEFVPKTTRNINYNIAATKAIVYS
jgi:hypothetical protein